MRRPPARAPARPSKKSRQKRRRGAALGQQPLDRAAEALGQRGERAERRRQQRSILARIIWASTGPAPSVPIATADRRAVDQAGVKKSQSSGRSTALTGMPCRRASSATAAVQRRRRRSRRRPARRRRDVRLVGRGRSCVAPLRRRASASSAPALRDDHAGALDWPSSRALASASSPSPTTTTAGPRPA